MKLDFSSNILEVAARLNKMAEDVKSVYEVEITNNSEYAVPVEFGYTREMVWADMSPAQRAAIILSAKKSTGFKGKAKVEKFDGGFRIIVPPVGMVAKTLPIAKSYGVGVMSTITQFSDHHFNGAISDIGAYALYHVSEETPVDTGDLKARWEMHLS